MVKPRASYHHNNKASLCKALIHLICSNFAEKILDTQFGNHLFVRVVMMILSLVFCCKIGNNNSQIILLHTFKTLSQQRLWTTYNRSYDWSWRLLKYLENWNGAQLCELFKAVRWIRQLIPTVMIASQRLASSIL